MLETECSGLGLAGMAIYLCAKVWECISHRLGRVIFIVLFHFDYDVVFSSFVIIFSTIFRTIFICFMSNLRVVSQRLSVNTSAGPCAQGLSCAWSKDQVWKFDTLWKHPLGKGEERQERHAIRFFFPSCAPVASARSSHLVVLVERITQMHALYPSLGVRKWSKILPYNASSERATCHSSL